MNAELFSWILAVEVALPFMVLSMVLLLMMRSGKKKYKEAARKLILKIKNNEERQRENLYQFLTGKLQLDEKKAKKTTTKIINERKFLFRNLISGLLEKNALAISMLEDDLSRISDHYHQLDISAAPPQEAPVETSNEADAEKINELKQEIKGLKHEVHVTLTTLNNIFGEFSSMFGEQVPDKEMSVDQIITAMETFSNKSGGHKVVDEDSDFAQEEPEELDELEEEGFDAFAELDDSDDMTELSPSSAITELSGSGKDSNVLDSDALDSDDSPMDMDDLDDIDSELDDIDSALDHLELGNSGGDDEPSWEDAFEESGDDIGKSGS